MLFIVYDNNIDFFFIASSESNPCACLFVITFDRYDQYGNARRKGHNDLRLFVLSLLFWSPEGNCAYTLAFCD